VRAGKLVTPEASLKNMIDRLPPGNPPTPQP
jgi:hypothetical protein